MRTSTTCSADGESYPRWWKPVYLDAFPDGEDTVQPFRRRLPYHLRTRTRTVRADRPHQLEGETTGDLRGTGLWTLTRTAGNTTDLRFDWRVHADRPLLRALTPLLRPVLRANHNWAIARAMEGIGALRPSHDEGENLSATPGTKALERAKVAFTTHTYEHDPKHESYGLEAAERLGLEPATVFKTLVAEVDGKLTVAIVPVERQLDLQALAAARKAKKAQMADVKQAERTTGYVAGGISPLGQRKPLPDRDRRQRAAASGDPRERRSPRPRGRAGTAGPRGARREPRSRRSAASGFRPR